jgi:hypothetical protein
MEAQPISLRNLTTKRRANLPLPQGEGRGGDARGSSIIIDEAFAGFTRIDAPQPRGGNDDVWRQTRQELVANVATQLEALDRQRAQLARLLHNIDTEAAF